MDYYNEFDPFAAEWLENLIREKVIPDGKVDRRSIKDVSANDLRGFRRIHFFAGIGGWALAIELAGWPEDLPIGTGSCPCQPFSAAGKGRAQSDERHLWPIMFDLVSQSGIDIWVGEQVPNAIGHSWLDGVFDDLESEGYACGATVLGAFSVGAPHKRSRLFWVADSSGHSGPEQRRESGLRSWGSEAQTDASECGGPSFGLADSRGAEREWRREPQGGCGELFHSSDCGGNGIVGNAPSERRDIESVDEDSSKRCKGEIGGPGTDGLANSDKLVIGRIEHAGQQSINESDRSPDLLEHAPGDGRDNRGSEPSGRCSPGGRRNFDAVALGDSIESRLEGLAGNGDNGDQSRWLGTFSDGPIAATGPWGDCEFIQCSDGKSRRIGRGVFPLAHGIPRDLRQMLAGLDRMGIDSAPLKSMARIARSNRVGRLKGYGNAIVPPDAAVFIRAFMDLKGFLKKCRR